MRIIRASVRHDMREFEKVRRGVRANSTALRERRESLSRTSSPVNVNWLRIKEFLNTQRNAVPFAKLGSLDRASPRICLV